MNIQADSEFPQPSAHGNGILYLIVLLVLLAGPGATPVVAQGEPARPRRFLPPPPPPPPGMGFPGAAWAPLTEKQILESRIRYFEDAGIPVQGYAFDNDIRNRRLMDIVRLESQRKQQLGGGIALVSVGAGLLALGTGLLASSDDGFLDFSAHAAPFLIGGAGCTLASVALFSAQDSTNRKLKVSKALAREEFMVK